MNSHSVLSGVVVETLAKKPNSRSSPSDFEAFLPWACGQLEIPLIPIINRITISKLPLPSTVMEIFSSNLVYLYIIKDY